MAKRKEGIRSLLGAEEGKVKGFECDYHIDHGAGKKQLVVECTGCNIEPDLNNQRCLGSVLNIMSEEVGIESVVLSHYEDTEYFGSAMDLLKKMVDFMDSIEDFTMRDPKEKYFDYLSDKDKKKLKCSDCELNPINVFPSLKKSFSESIEKYERQYNRIIQKIDRASLAHEECEECTFSTLDDLDYLQKEYEELYRMTERELSRETS